MAKYCGTYSNLDDCLTCYPLTASYCSGYIDIPSGLTLSVGDQFYIWITDKFDNKFYDVVTVSASGSVVMDSSEFPVGLFNPFGGNITMYLSTDSDGVDIIPIPGLTYSWMGTQSGTQSGFTSSYCAIVNYPLPKGEGAS